MAKMCSKCRARHIEILRIFGKRMRALRRAKDMTQKQLAERAGLSLQSIGQLERGRGNPTLLNEEKLSSALDVDLPALFDFDGIGLSKEQALLELSHLLDGAADEQVRAILNMARVMLHK